MSNYIAAWGPSGPMYLAKTEIENEYYVINGDWIIDMEDPTNEYYIIQDNILEGNYNTVCENIRAHYDETVAYPILRYLNHTPYEKDNKDEIVGSKIVNQKAPINKLKGVTEETRKFVKEFTNPLSTHELDTTEIEAKAICEHFGNVTNEVSTSIAKQLIAKGYKIPQKEKTMSPETDIVTVKTVNLVNGIDVKDLNANDLLNSVMQLEANIKKLTEIESNSDFIVKTITKQRNVLATVIKHLDTKG